MSGSQIFNGTYMTFCLFMALYKAHKKRHLHDYNVVYFGDYHVH